MQETRVFLTNEKEYNPASRISDQVKRFLMSLPLDTHDKRYVVRVSVEEVLEPQY